MQPKTLSLIISITASIILFILLSLAANALFSGREFPLGWISFLSTSAGIGLYTLISNYLRPITEKAQATLQAFTFNPENPPFTTEKPSPQNPTANLLLLDNTLYLIRDNDYGAFITARKHLDSPKEAFCRAFRLTFKDAPDEIHLFTSTQKDTYDTAFLPRLTQILDVAEVYPIIPATNTPLPNPSTKIFYYPSEDPDSRTEIRSHA